MRESLRVSIFTALFVLSGCKSEQVNAETCALDNVRYECGLLQITLINPNEVKSVSALKTYIKEKNGRIIYFDKDLSLMKVQFAKTQNDKQLSKLRANISKMDNVYRVNLAVKVKLD